MELLSWATTEAASAKFGDKRLNRRLARILQQLVAAPGASIPQACGSWAATKACYNFLAHDQVTAEKIAMTHQSRTVDRLQQHAEILLLQDSSSLDFTTKPKTSGLGYLHREHSRGIMMHTAMAVSPDGEVLGVLAQHAWVRPLSQYGKRQQRKQTSTDTKETQHWLDVRAEAIAAVPEQVRVISVADREADFYEFFAADRPAHVHLLLRVGHNRRVGGEAGRLHRAIEQTPEAGRCRVEVGRANNRSARTAELRIRYRDIEIVAPQRRNMADAESLPASIRLCLVQAQEVDAPAGDRPIEWLLLTSLPVDDVDSAMRCVQLYSRRWLIERFHYTLKSGCAIEELQLQSVERLQKALAVLSIVAWRLLWLLYHSRISPDASSAEFLQEQEWRLLDAHEHRGKRSSAAASAAAELRGRLVKPPTLRQAVLWIAKLGGFLGRRGDGDPGIKTLWRGLRRLNDMIETLRLLQNNAELMGNG